MTGIETSLCTTQYNNSLALHPPFLESIPLEICLHGCNATDSAVISIALQNHAALESSVAMSVLVPYTKGIFHE